MVFIINNIYNTYVTKKNISSISSSFQGNQKIVPLRAGNINYKKQIYRIQKLCINHDSAKLKTSKIFSAKIKQIQIVKVEWSQNSVDTLCVSLNESTRIVFWQLIKWNDPENILGFFDCGGDPIRHFSVESLDIFLCLALLAGFAYETVLEPGFEETGIEHRGIPISTPPLDLICEDYKPQFRVGQARTAQRILAEILISPKLIEQSNPNPKLQLRLENF